MNPVADLTTASTEGGGKKRERTTQHLLITLVQRKYFWARLDTQATKRIRCISVGACVGEPVTLKWSSHLHVGGGYVSLPYLIVFPDGPLASADVC